MDFKELREQLTDEMLKSVLIQFDVEPRKQFWSRKPISFLLQPSFN